MRLLRFYLAVLRTAFSGRLGAAKGVFFLGSLFVAVAKAVFGYEIILNAPAEWTLLAGVLAGFGWQLIRAPETLHSAAVERAMAAERRCAELGKRLDGRQEHQAMAGALANLHFDGASLRHMALTHQIDYGEVMMGYFDWLTRAEDVVARQLPVAQANLFNSIAPPIGKEHDDRRRGEDAILAALGRRLGWLEARASEYQRLAVSGAGGAP